MEFGGKMRNEETGAPRRGRGHWAGPPVSAALVREIDIIGHMLRITRRDETDLPALARAAGLSGDVLTKVVRTGTRPSLETLQKLALLAQTVDPDYSVVRLFIAADWVPEDDVLRYQTQPGATDYQKGRTIDALALTLEEKELLVRVLGRLARTPIALAGGQTLLLPDGTPESQDQARADGTTQAG